MSTDKTLADVQPGGRVRLGDQAERARFESWSKARGLDLHRLKHTGGYRGALSADAWAAWQAALSAQPSPGGQGAALGDEIDLIRAVLDGYPESIARSDALRATRVIRAALSARQPVEAAPQGCDACDRTGIRQNDEGRNICCPDCDLGRACAGDTRRPVGEPVGQVRTRVDGGFIAELFPGVADRVSNLAPLYAAPAQAVDLGPALIPDTPEVRDILGRPNFWCSPWANVLRMRGDAIPHKAEEEQAAVLRFMLNHYLANGTAWAETAGTELDAIRKADSKAVGK